MNATRTFESFEAECHAWLAENMPDFVYSRADLFGFISAAWPCEGEPADVAEQFAEEVCKQAE